MDCGAACLLATHGTITMKTASLLSYIPKKNKKKTNRRILPDIEKAIFLPLHRSVLEKRGGTRGNNDYAGRRYASACQAKLDSGKEKKERIRG